MGSLDPFTYAVVSDDGNLTLRADTRWRAQVGPEGPAQVRLHPRHGLAGWVNDVSHAHPGRYPRNVVGAVMLMTLGAREQPFAGPVVLTGWDPPPGREVCPLPEGGFVERLHGQVRRALGMDAGPITMPREWVGAVQVVAAFVRAAAAPAATCTVLGGSHV